MAGGRLVGGCGRLGFTRIAAAAHVAGGVHAEKLAASVMARMAGEQLARTVGETAGADAGGRSLALVAGGVGSKEPTAGNHAVMAGIVRPPRPNRQAPALPARQRRPNGSQSGVGCWGR